MTVQNCAIFYVPEAYRGDMPFVVGRQSAGEGFLRAFVDHSGVDRFYCYTDKDADFAQFAEQVKGFGGAAASACQVKPYDFSVLAEAGCLFQPGPMIAESAWLRRYAQERLFSICGITHSVATERAIRGIRDFITAPTQPWDALICTSQAVQRASRRILQTWTEYLKQRGFQFELAPVQSRVIPLGVTPEKFDRTPERIVRGKDLRKRLGVPENAVLGLYFGRLNVFSKSHPTPMFRAVELAQRMLPPRTLHLLLAGQFNDRASKIGFAAARRAFCPTVEVHWVDGGNSETAHDCWFASDFFISLSDNVQESFGLTPVEAMAASLPCVVSDWNGYKETVVHNHTGFLIPTTMPPPDCGIELADEMARHAFSHFLYIGTVSQSIAVDIDCCAAAIARLARDSALRRRMGDAGRARVEHVYDWRRVIAQYQDLWRELAEIRTSAQPLGARRAAHETVHPDYPDLFSVFRDHSSRTLGKDGKIRLAGIDARYVLGQLQAIGIHSFSNPMLAGKSAIEEIFSRLECGDCCISALLEGVEPQQHGRILRTILWLYKYGLVTLE